MKKLLALAAVLFCLDASSQAPIEQGIITFERKKSLHKILDYAYGKSSWVDDMKKNLPKVKSEFFKMSFSGNESVYVPLGEEDMKRSWGEMTANRNVVYNNFTTGLSISEKQVFEDTYLLTDSIKPVRWRITNEYREIAGYMCRKATTVIMDSVYVIAFYTESLVTPSGPESFKGLPGMILGIAIPRLHTNWMAVKVESGPVAKDVLKAPTKGKKSNTEDLRKKLLISLESWGKLVHRIVWHAGI